MKTLSQESKIDNLAIAVELDNEPTLKELNKAIASLINGNLLEIPPEISMHGKPALL